MYIKNQTFNDEETLMEMLFDFSLGEAAPLIIELKEEIEKELESNTAFKEYRATLTDEEDRLELETEERLIRLSEALLARFDRFQTKEQKLYGIKNGEETVLYEIDLI
ncbi:MAG TPA: hypothetical protein PL009_05135 [Flavipsychrobacter sp.]|nr:hypothetical protein [Flavipsychrobacter sp.]